jgi:hypothetical protein
MSPPLQVHVAATDVCNAAALAAFAQSLDSACPIDLVVANAGRDWRMVSQPAAVSREAVRMRGIAAGRVWQAWWARMRLCPALPWCLVQASWHATSSWQTVCVL